MEEIEAANSEPLNQNQCLLLAGKMLTQDLVRFR